MTGLSIVIAGTWNIGLEGVAVTTKAFPDDITVPGAVFILYFDDLPGVLCIYNDSWMGLLQ